MLLGVVERHAELDLPAGRDAELRFEGLLRVWRNGRLGPSTLPVAHGAAARQRFLRSS